MMGWPSLKVSVMCEALGFTPALHDKNQERPTSPLPTQNGISYPDLLG